ncbi:MAG: tRNA preQ1(34) S-adenosylmethionine ribosyltransferase-isomerase QueA [Deltaproteobacteria bacterium]|nr:tRNA preQ1(34) S-adenosylmethionine ribosyltransferase-isomerase QueA [Deltaproteobacteria bacterium]
MRIDLLDFELPPERIAQEPPADREGARLLVVDAEGPFSAALRDAAIVDLAELVPQGALLVVNDTRVLPARLLARKPETGGKVEIFLVRPEGPGSYERPMPDGAPLVVEGEIWRALGKSSKPLRFDRDLEVGEDLSVRILGRADDDGLLRVLLVSNRPILEAIEAYGQVPLPPYIKRAPTETDVERYQTVFARRPGAVAAPTAGLHLTERALGRLAIAGCDVVSVTLHVGLGTFQPVQVADLDQHPMHHEAFEVSRATAQAIVKARREGRPVLAVGTTAVRALETAARIAEQRGSSDPIVACSGSTNLLLQPGEPIRVVDAMLTNFHLPKSTLLALVASFIGVHVLRAAYAHAIAHDYRFYSYGDAMLIRRKLPVEQVLESVRRAQTPGDAG